MLSAMLKAYHRLYVAPSARRFLFMGSCSTVFNYFIFLVVYRGLDQPFGIASCAGYIAGLFVGYRFNKDWTFRSVLHSHYIEFLLYASVYFTSLIISLVVLNSLISLGGVYPPIANLLAIGASSVTNFIGCKYIIFNHSTAGILTRTIDELCLERKTLKLITLGLSIKIFVAFIISSPVMENLFIPFMQYFLLPGGKNPYQHFYELGIFDAFPYSSVMLWILSAPTIVFRLLGVESLSSISIVGMFLAKSPILIADSIIFLVLCMLVPARSQRIVFFYWLNPIVIYVNYFHGQLDAIPTALFLVSLLCLLRRYEKSAFLIYALSISAKSHLLAALPIYAAFSYFRNASIKRVVLMTGGVIAIYLLAQLPFLSEGFTNLVLLESKSQRLFQVFFSFDEDSGLRFLFAPAVIAVIFFGFLSKRTTDQNFLMITMGLLFAAMNLLVNPMPGWYLWSLPFMVYFFVKYPSAPGVFFISFSCLYLAYFLYIPSSDVFLGLSFIFPAMRHWPSPYQLTQYTGLNAKLIQNLIFTVFQANLLVILFWTYRVGISNSSLIRKFSSGFSIGIGGDSGVGKSTVASTLTRLFGKRNTLVVAGDDLHKWERGHKNWQIFTHLDPKSNYLHRDLAHARALSNGYNIYRSNYDHDTGKFTNSNLLESNRFTIFQGLHTFYLKKMRDILNLKIFVQPDEELRIYWKIKRDMVKRGYTKDQVLSQIALRQKDSELYINRQRQFADIVIQYLPQREGLTSEDMLELDDVSIKLRIFVVNDLNIEHFSNLIKGYSSMMHHYWYEPNDDVIVLECQGTISSKCIGLIASKLVENYRELLDHFPVWDENYLGIIQLVALLYFDHYYHNEVK